LVGDSIAVVVGGTVVATCPGADILFCERLLQ